MFKVQLRIAKPNSDAQWVMCMKWIFHLQHFTLYLIYWHTTLLWLWRPGGPVICCLEARQPVNSGVIRSNPLIWEQEAALSPLVQDQCTRIIGLQLSDLKPGSSSTWAHRVKDKVECPGSIKHRNAFPPAFCCRRSRCMGWCLLTQVQTVYLTYWFKCSHLLEKPSVTHRVYPMPHTTIFHLPSHFGTAA